MGLVTVAEFREYLEQLKKYSPQSITVTGAPSGGTFKLGYEGEETADIAFDALATDVRTALSALTVAPEDVEVTGPAGGPWTATSQSFAGPISLDTNALTGGTTPSVEIELVTDDMAQRIIERATSMIEEILGFTYAGYEAGTKTVQAYGGTLLKLPPHELGSVTLLTFLNDTFAVTGWTETEAGNLMVGTTYPYDIEWSYARYVVTGNWGYGDAPESIKEVCLELAVNIWQGRARGMWTDTVNGDGAQSVRFTGGLTSQQRDIINAVKRKYRTIPV